MRNFIFGYMACIGTILVYEIGVVTGTRKANEEEQ